MPGFVRPDRDASASAQVTQSSLGNPESLPVNDKHSNKQGVITKSIYVLINCFDGSVPYLTYLLMQMKFI